MSRTCTTVNPIRRRMDAYAHAMQSTGGVKHGGPGRALTARGDAQHPESRMSTPRGWKNTPSDETVGGLATICP
jgi:hypothetical protein